MSVWTFDGIALTWLRQELHGMPIDPGWKTLPRLVTHPLAGLKSAVTAQIGFEPTVITGPIWFGSLSLITKNGLAGTLTNGGTSWTAVMHLDHAQLRVSTDGYVATATFTRADVVA